MLLTINLEIYANQRIIHKTILVKDETYAIRPKSKMAANTELTIRDIHQNTAVFIWKQSGLIIVVIYTASFTVA